MLSFQNAIKYIGLAAIFYFLIKAFANEKLTNIQIALAVICIMVLVIFIGGQNFTCQQKIERFQEINSSIIAPLVQTDSLNEDSLNEAPLQAPSTGYAENNYENNYENDDIEDLKEIINFDDEQYQKIKNNEKNAMNKIKSKYQNEMVYTTTHPFNTVPLGAQLYGYTYLPPENWFRAYETPPICIMNKRRSVHPVNNPYIAGLMEFDSGDNVVEHI